MWVVWAGLIPLLFSGSVVWGILWYNCLSGHFEGIPYCSLGLLFGMEGYCFIFYIWVFYGIIVLVGTLKELLGRLVRYH